MLLMHLFLILTLLLLLLITMFLLLLITMFLLLLIIMFLLLLITMFLLLAPRSPNARQAHLVMTHPVKPLLMVHPCSANIFLRFRLGDEGGLAPEGRHELV